MSKQESVDWHNADIKAALEKAGWSIARLSRAAGYKVPGTMSRALQQPWLIGERTIAYAIGVKPVEIWPSRYPDGFEARRRARNHDSKWREIVAKLDDHVAQETKKAG
ncbi:helix-turn-helix domain-containing protein [Marinobacterium litorale]|uniref:helix-turn-helix domain-containing protein n=1 Tax=Marinobacterium litorale TaxID=404770 RepID=UPI000415896E|nr:helix-turn-helix domain-containing protein [Marinobacterium litorale]